MHYYQRNIGDYSKKAGRLSMIEHGAYTLLMDACYDRERFPTRDEAIDWTWARTQEEIAAVDFVLSKFFELRDGVYVQARIEEEINSYREKCQKNQHIALAREASRRARRETSVNESSTERAQSVHESPPNQEPITNNQEPIKEPPQPPRRRGSGFDASTIDLPGWLDREDWQSWVADRKARKKPITEEGARRQLKQLADYRADGHQPADVIANSIAGGYQGLFPPRGQIRASPPTRAQAMADWNAELGAVLAEGRRATVIDMGTIDATH